MRKTAILTLLLTGGCLFAGVALERMKPYVVDRVIVAEAGSESEHGLRERDSAVAPGRDRVAARSAKRGGSFSYQLKTASAEIPQLLHVRYSGDERPAPGEKLLFRVNVNGRQVAVQGINRNFPNQFIDEFYELPPELLKSGQVTVSLEPRDAGSSVAGVYAVSILRKKSEFGRFDDLRNFRGLKMVDGKGVMPIPGSISYLEPDGPEGWRSRGWLMQGDGVYDMTRHYGLELTVDLQNADSAALEFVATMNTLPKEDRDTGNLQRHVTLQLPRAGKQTVYLPFEKFANPTANISDVMYKLKQLELKTVGKSGTLVIDSIRVIDGYKVALKSLLGSQPAAPGETVTYELSVTNTDRVRSAYDIRWIKRNWEAMESVVEPASLLLEPGATATVKVHVTVPAKIPAGGHERQIIEVTPNGDPGAAARAEFVTLAKMPHPFTIHDARGWQEVREKAQRYDWAEKRLEKHVADAEKWVVPVPHEFALSPDTKRPYLVKTTEELNLMNAAIAYQLTGNEAFAEKVALFLRRICDPVSGFPKTRQVGNQSEVQEGHVFQHLAQAYDLIYNSPALTVTDRRDIEATLRLFCDMILRNNRHPAGANWALSSQTGAFFCALALQDLKLAEEFVFGPGMVIDKLRSYTMSDGWWYECSISYNLWCAEEFTQIALALERFGYSMLNNKYQVSYCNVPDNPVDDATEWHLRNNVHYGHSFRIFGNIEKNSLSIKSMFDALLPYIDYRGWIFGVNDSYENNVGGGRFELAYYAFRDPRYAAFIKTAPVRDNLVYGVGELPAETPEIGKGSAYSDNAGILMLRSTQKEPRERIQAVLKYGTHGGYHGHYDRTGLLSLMRYGRSFFNPEMVWYSYQPFMYNFYVQSSIAKNMVTVDFKQQAVDESARILYHTGDRLQAGAVETTAVWSNPGYGGLRWGHIGFPTFSSKAESEGRFVPVPQPEPRYGAMSGYTEPVLQRRLMAITADYVVLADYSAGQATHDFDQLFQIKGLLGTNAKKSGHSAQLDPDPLKSAQFVTDVNWYEVKGTAEFRFLTRFGAGADNRGTRINGEPGDLYINLYNAWPSGERTVFTGTVPENHGVARKLFWSVKGDGKVLASGKFGAWLLGEGRVDLPLANVKSLELSAAIEKRGKVNTLFWADAVLETADGGTIPLSQLKAEKVNVLDSKFGYEQDYEGGKINIAGVDYKTGLPADPVRVGERNPAVYRYDLSGLNAVRLRAVVGGDYPVGSEKERRITTGIRSKGKEAVFLTVMEPFEKESVIAGVVAPDAEHLEVTLKDGRVQKFEIRNLTGSGRDVSICMTEFRNGTKISEEVAK